MHKDTEFRKTNDALLRENVVDIKGLSFTRPSSDQSIFNGVDIQIKRGKVTAIMGPSGCGKTTLLRLIGGQLMPEAGSILLDGESIAKMSRDRLYQVRRKMGLLFQNSALFSDMNVFENVAFPLREHTDLPESMIRDLVLMKLQAVGLRGARHLMPNELSGGMRRRVALARALALDPHLIMYDEPFAGQDPISMGVLVQLIRLINDTLKLTTIIVSHDVEETASIADYIYILSEGKIQGEGTPKELLSEGSNWVKQFMQGLPDGPVPFHYPARNFANDLWGASA